MKPVLIWDLPTRIFHWLLAAGFITAAVISLALGDDSPLFPYHAICGLTIGLLVVIRVIWGFVGTRHARFGAFAFGPAAVVEYMKGVLLGGGRRYTGHNPGSAVAIFALLALVLAMAATGIMLGQGDESMKDVHEVLAWVTVGFVVLHVAGVALHAIRRHENLTAGMIHGKKLAEPTEAISSARPAVAVLFLVILGGWAFGLVRGFNATAQTTTLPIFGTVLQLGEGEGRDGDGREQRRDRDDDD